MVNKKNQGGSVEEEVVKCGSKASENNPAKEEIPGEKIVQNRENAASNSVGVETQFQHLCIKKTVEEDVRDRIEVNGPVRLNSGQGYYRNKKHDGSSTRVIKATRTMVWVKKGENDAAGGGNASESRRTCVGGLDTDDHGITTFPKALGPSLGFDSCSFGDAF